MAHPGACQARNASAAAASIFAASIFAGMLWGGTPWADTRAAVSASRKGGNGKWANILRLPILAVYYEILFSAYEFVTLQGCCYCVVVSLANNLAKTVQL